MRKELNIKQKRVMIYFITAAKELIESEGVEKLTVRKAAAAAGYNSATLYNYFEDMEELVIFASMGYLKQYIVDLENTLEDSMNALERYRTIYKVFGKTCLKRPEIFYYLFYGKYKKKLKMSFQYTMNFFRMNWDITMMILLKMLTQGEIMERDRAIMPSLVEQGFVAEENVNQTVVLMTRMFQSYLYDAWQGHDTRQIEEQMKLVMETFDYIMDKAAPQK